MTSEIRTNSITSRAGMSTVTMTDSGPMFSGITTFVDNSGFTFGVGGGTSIFTPATNVLTFGTNNTEKIRIDASGHMHGVGVITATHFYGDGSNLTGISAGTSLSGSTNNTVCTVTGANAIQGETKLTFDSTTTQLKITRDDDSNSGFYVFHNDGNECARLVNKGSGHEGALLLQDGGTPTVYFDGETGSRSYINTGAGLAIGTQNLVSGRPDNVLHLHKASSGTANGPTIYFTNQQTGVTGSDGFTVGIDDAQSPYLWNRENTATRFGTNNAERFRITSDGNLLLGTTTAAIGGGRGMMIANSAGARIKLCDSDQGVDSGSGFEMIAGNGGTGYIWNRENQAILFGTNGTERMRITHEGSVGIGTNNSTYELEVHDGSGAAALRLKDGANNVICDLIAGSTGGHLRTTYNHPLKFSTNQVERMRINTDGSLLYSNNLASAVPNGQFGFRMDRGGGNGTSLHVENLNNDSVNNNAEVRLVTNHSNCRMVHHNQGGFYIIQSGYGYLHYYSNGVSRFICNPDGKFGVNDSTSGWAEKLQVTGNYGSGQYGIAAKITSSSGSLMRFGTSSGLCGSISGSGTGCSYNTSSDYRLKENDVNIIDGISRVKQLRPIRFNWKSDPSKIEDGFFAHEVSPVVPESVTGEKDAEIDEIGEGYQKIDHSKLIPLLTASIKELITKVETLEEENIALRARVTNLEGE